MRPLLFALAVVALALAARALGLPTSPEHALVALTRHGAAPPAFLVGAAYAALALRRLRAALARSARRTAIHA